MGNRFDPKILLLDPYARAIAGGEIWGTPVTQWVSLVVADSFDWEGDRPLQIPLKDTVIYELHVRGYTVDPSSGVAHPGTFKGLIEKIPHIRSLGVTAVELLPVFEFGEMEKKPTNPKTGERLKNYWGYGPLGFFAPKASYSSRTERGKTVLEFKEMVKAFHRAGLEVILDVVFNHTAERDATGPTTSFRGLDNTVYYAIHGDTKEYVNISGCGNTFNCNHPVARALIIDSLRYWVEQMHVDGFRFDLAAILGRDDNGDLLLGPSLIHDIEQDPLLADTKIIAEAWDMGTHLVGGFPGRWVEWNSFFRDDFRRFVRGDSGMVPAIATRIAGSSDLYKNGGRSPSNSINFITCHDGFTLYDLVSYNKKHNIENGEENRDGSDDNASANCGIEGPTEDQDVNALRARRIKTFFTLLMVSHGVPMILAGDEFCRTQQGNNNAYCQDNAISWTDWQLVERHGGVLRFVQKMVALRHGHPVFRRATFLSGRNNHGGAAPDISWHGLALGKPDWSENARCLAFMLAGDEVAAPEEKGGPNKEEKDCDFFIMVNGDKKERTFELSSPPEGLAWFRLIDTGKPSPEDIRDENRAEPVLHDKYPLLPSAAAVFIAKRLHGDYS
jgi:glycogen operon protein